MLALALNDGVTDREIDIDDERDALPVAAGCVELGDVVADAADEGDDVALALRVTLALALPVAE